MREDEVQIVAAASAISVAAAYLFQKARQNSSVNTMSKDYMDRIEELQHHPVSHSWLRSNRDALSPDPHADGYNAIPADTPMDELIRDFARYSADQTSMQVNESTRSDATLYIPPDNRNVDFVYRNY